MPQAGRADPTFGQPVEPLHTLFALLRVFADRLEIVLLAGRSVGAPDAASAQAAAVQLHAVSGLVHVIIVEHGIVLVFLRLVQPDADVRRARLAALVVAATADHTRRLCFVWSVACVVAVIRLIVGVARRVSVPRAQFGLARQLDRVRFGFARLLLVFGFLLGLGSALIADNARALWIEHARHFALGHAGNFGLGDVGVQRGIALERAAVDARQARVVAAASR